MRRLILYSFIAILTFAAGVSVDLLFYRFVPVTVSLCQLARHPEWYDGKLVRVKASAMQIHGAVSVWDDSCKGIEAGAMVMLGESFQPDAEVESLVAASGPEIRNADVLVIGRFNQNATRGCYGPRFGIHPSSIELRSRVAVEPAVKLEE